MGLFNKIKKDEKGFIKLDVKQVINYTAGTGAGCVASNRITKDGYKVGYMVKRMPSKNFPDTGWLFYAGDEDQAYSDDAKNFNVFDINTICNYDSDIIPYVLENGSKDQVELIRVDDKNFIVDNGTLPIHVMKNKF